MPTGYTATLMEKGQSFEDFALQCARAFGACITLRDEPMDKPIPKFKPDSYHAKSLAESEKELARLKKMGLVAQVRFGEAQKQKSLKSLKDALARNLLENSRLDEVLSRAQQWQPPSKDHDEFKRFMIDQLRISKNDTGYYDKQIQQEQTKRPLDFYNDAVASAVRSIEYDKEEIAAEQKRCNTRNQWVEQLREALKPTKTKGAKA